MGGNVLWALTAFTSKANPALNAAVSLAGVLIASTPGMHGQHDDRTPIADTRKAIDHILDELQDRQYGYVRQHLEDEKADIPGASVDDMVDRVLRDLFDDRVLLKRRGGAPEINKPAIEDDIYAKAMSLYERFKSEVNPIGEGVWGHAKNVLIQIKGGRYNGREAMAERKVSDGRETYWWKHWIDDDLRAAAEARTSEVDEITTVVDERAVENINDIANLAWPREVPK